MFKHSLIQRILQIMYIGSNIIQRCPKVKFGYLLAQHIINVEFNKINISFIQNSELNYHDNKNGDIKINNNRRYKITFLRDEEAKKTQQVLFGRWGRCI